MDGDADRSRETTRTLMHRPRRFILAIAVLAAIPAKTGFSTGTRVIQP